MLPRWIKTFFEKRITMKTSSILTASFLGLMSLSTFAATIDGSITASEYQWNTNGVEGSVKWNTHGGTQELNDASGGDVYDINFLGTNVAGGKFQFGAIGGEILSGRKVSSSPDIFLSDFAISISNPTSANPTTSSIGFDYAIHLVGVNDVTGVASFELLSGGTWVGADIYGSTHAPEHITETYRMVGGTVLAAFNGVWSANADRHGERSEVD